jgi:hypothetical protein
MDPQKYTYGNLTKFTNMSFLLYSLIFIGGGLFFLYRSILSFFNSGGIESSVAYIILYFLVGVWSPFFFIYLAYLRADVEVEEDGLLIKFVLKTLYVKWEEICLLKQARYLGFRMSRKNSVVITNKALTPFHCIYGLLYGQTNQPAFLILSDISRYNELIETIKGNIKKKN